MQRKNKKTKEQKQEDINAFRHASVTPKKNPLKKEKEKKKDVLLDTNMYIYGSIDYCIF